MIGAPDSGSNWPFKRNIPSRPSDIVNDRASRNARSRTSTPATSSRASRSFTNPPNTFNDTR
ncbi:MAG TPA: hypothetical protein VFC82_03965, partial [Actinomycetaceae bacterium]|nr:hypothetical protein [Actinomycetaceae bacterium]